MCTHNLSTPLAKLLNVINLLHCRFNTLQWQNFDYINPAAYKNGYFLLICDFPTKSQISGHQFQTSGLLKSFRAFYLHFP